MDLQSKIVIVTGASSGIGRATAQLLSQKGANVVLAARSKDKLLKLSKELPNSFVIPTDMTKEEEIKSLVKKTLKHFGRVDILINNAGQGYDAPIENTSVQTFTKIFQLDVIGPLLAMQQVIPIMRQQGEGVIVNISSGTALMVLPNMGGYSALKQALAKISLTSRIELEKDNIHVSVVYPYITDTAFEKHTIKDIPKEAVNEEDGGYTPPPGDSPEFVAEKIVETIEKNPAEMIVHDWMKPEN